MITLRGITWNHSRALPPLVATAQRFEELHPGVQIHWSKRSLHEFGHGDVLELARQFDLVVLDHPWIGYAVAHGCLMSLDDHVPAETLADWRENSVGRSYASYIWDDALWAAPIDAAAPAAAARFDERFGPGDVPGDYEELVGYAARGLVAVPAFPPDLLLHLLMLCASREPEMFVEDAEFAPQDVTLQAMDDLRRLVEHIPRAYDDANPIATFERMASGDGPPYCPFAYTYSNYARPGYGRKLLTFLDPPDLRRGQCLRSVLGGTGLAVSAECAHADIAFEYLSFTASARVQRTLYTAAGGQPAHRSAWGSPANDQLSSGFFRATLPSVDRAWLRPRYYGYPRFQEQAGVPLLRWIRNGGSAKACLDEMNGLYQLSRSLTYPAPVRDDSQL